jgi:7-carboxy-7-deazaguanine synthase
MNEILVSEIFGPTIQGEGALAGAPTVFVRTGGCDFRCSWCDTPHAVLPCNRPTWEPMSAGRVMGRVAELAGFRPLLVTLSGGNPVLQPLPDLIDLGHEAGYTFALETQGSICKPWLHKLDHLILSPKPPSSGMAFRASRLADCIDAAAVGREFSPDGGGLLTLRPRTQISLKVVVMTEEDYEFARYVYRAFAVGASIPFYLTPGNHTPPAGSGWNDAGHEFDQEGVLARARWLVERVARDRFYAARIIPQLHTLLWQNRQGV